MAMSREDDDWVDLSQDGLEKRKDIELTAKFRGVSGISLFQENPLEAIQLTGKLFMLYYKL